MFIIKMNLANPFVTSLFPRIPNRQNNHYFYWFLLLPLAFDFYMAMGRDFKVTESQPTTTTAPPSDGKTNIFSDSSKSTNSSSGLNSSGWTYVNFVCVCALLKAQWEWWVASTDVRVDWRYTLILNGAQCVTMHGTSLTLRLCVASWAVERPQRREDSLSSGLEKEQSCWTIWSVVAQNPSCWSAHIYPGTCTTVTTLKMLASPAHCCDFSNPTLPSPPRDLYL